jgi:DNA-binding NtrC family response regulator
MTNKIVIVDDDTYILDLLKKSFLGYDYQVFGVNDSTKAVDLIKKEIPSLILIDLYMPKLNGLDLGYAIKTIPELQDIPIMFMSSHPTLDNAKLAFFLGAVDLIEKPIKIDELINKAKASIELCELKRLINKFLGDSHNGSRNL